MALVDPNIALSFKQPNFQPTNALAQYAQIAQIQGNQQQQQLNALKMQEAQATMQERNALRSLDPRSANYENQLFRLNPQLGISYRKERTAADASEATQKKQQTDTEAKLLEQARNFLPGVKDQASYDNWRAVTLKNLPGYESYLPPAYSEEGVQQLMMTADKALENHYFQQNTGGEVVQYGVNKFGPPGTPTAVQTSPMTPLPQDVEAQKTRITLAGRNVTNINMGPQETEFERELGGGQAKSVLAGHTAALDAASILETNKTGREILKSGAITGAGANFFVGLNSALLQAGIDLGFGDATANSQAYAASLGANVGRIIKQFGAGTGLSDADRAYAEQMAGGKISLTESALRKILDINDRAARKVIKLHNEKVKDIKSKTSLRVEIPEAPVSAADQIPTSRPAGVGANWTLERDANGNTAWVSPDRKSFKEAR